MKTRERKEVELIRDELQEKLEALEVIRDNQNNRGQIEILTDCCASIKEVIDHLGEI